jgi:guanine deaminase
MDRVTRPTPPEPSALAPLPDHPPFAIRGRVVTPLATGGMLDLADGVVVVDGAGRIEAVVAAADRPDLTATAVDRRGDVLLPGFVDLHAHLPQLPSAGLGAGLGLLPWLERHVFPLERGFDRPAAERLAPLVFRAFAAAGSTTVVAYAAVFPASTDAAFAAAESHGIRAVIGQVLMDRDRYEERLPATEILDASIRESAAHIERWNGRDGGRLRYAVTPRFAVACTADLLRASAELAAATGTYWQTHLAEDRGEIATVAARFPEARDYLDVYDRAGGLGERAILAHAVHLSDREVGRLVETRACVAHCPSSNAFLASGAMPLARYLDAGVRLGLGSDVAGGPEASLLAVARIGASVAVAVRDGDAGGVGPPGPLDWLRLATIDGARCLGLDATIGSLEVGKEADLVVVDPARTAPPGGPAMPDDPADLVSRLIHRGHPDLVRAAWVRGRRLPGPAGWEPPAGGHGA